MRTCSRNALAAALFFLPLSAEKSRGSVIVTIAETAGGVSFNVSGSLDLGGYALDSSSVPAPPSGFGYEEVTFGSGAILVSTGSGAGDRYVETSAGTVIDGAIRSAGPPSTNGIFPNSQGDGFFSATFASPLGFPAPLNEIVVPAGYQSGAPIGISGTAAGATLTDLGFLPDSTLVVTLPVAPADPSDFRTQTITFQTVAVPEPSTLSLLLPLVFVAARRHRR